MASSTFRSRAPAPPRARTSQRRRVETQDLHAYARDRDAATRERLVLAYLPLAYSVARRFDRGGPVSQEDLQQVAAVGLLKALERFDPDRGVAFSSFAVPTIQGELRRCFRDLTWAVRPPRELQEHALRVARARERLTSALGRSPTTAELAAHLDTSPEAIVDGLLAAQARSSDSLQRRVRREDGDDRTLGDTLGTDDPGFSAAESAVMARDLLALLSERDALVVRLRFHDELTQAEIGQRVGCSQMHVSRILRAALATLACGSSPGDGR